MMEGGELDNVLHHLGIDPSENTLDVIYQLMNCTLQCLGGIRLLFEKLERERIAQHVTAVEEANQYKTQLGLQHWSVKRAFSFATDRMMYEINRTTTNSEIHNLNPSRHLIESFPNGACYLKKEWLAAHWTILGDARFEEERIVSQELKNDQLQEQILVLDNLSSVFPSCFKEADNFCRSVFHFAARLDSVPLFNSVCENARKAFPNSGDGLTITNATVVGVLPLHNAARFSPSLPLFLRVEQECKEALTKCDDDGMTPLHWAAAKNQNIDIIRHLLKTCPAGSIEAPNQEGYLPLHLAGQNDCLEVVQLIYETFPKAIGYQDQEGGFPIHHACSLSKNIEVVKFLYERYPDSILHPQHHGITPLHLAASQNDFLDLFRFILSKSPDSLFIRDAVHCLPVDCLIMRFEYGVDQKLFFCYHYLLQMAAASSHPFDDFDGYSLRLSENSDNDGKSITSAENDLITKGDAVARTFLTYRFPNSLQLKRLNRLARKLSVLLCITLSRTNVENINEEKIITQLIQNYHLELLLTTKTSKFDRKPSRSSQPFHHCSQSDKNYIQAKKECSLFIVLAKLCRTYISPYHNDIPSGILRVVIDFL
jgi:ankyrin repeat protein